MRMLTELTLREEEMRWMEKKSIVNVYSKLQREQTYCATAEGRKLSE